MSCDEPPTRRKNVLRRSDDQFMDNASYYINILDHLDSLHFSSDVGQCTSKAMDLQRLRLLQQLYEAHHLNVQNQIVIAQTEKASTKAQEVFGEALALQEVGLWTQ